jgi:hypothetical protein
MFLNNVGGKVMGFSIRGMQQMMLSSYVRRTKREWRRQDQAKMRANPVRVASNNSSSDGGGLWVFILVIGIPLVCFSPLFGIILPIVGMVLFILKESNKIERYPTTTFSIPIDTIDDTHWKSDFEVPPKVIVPMECPDGWIDTWGFTDSVNAMYATEEREEKNEIILPSDNKVSDSQLFAQKSSNGKSFIGEDGYEYVTDKEELEKSPWLKWGRIPQKSKEDSLRGLIKVTQEKPLKDVITPHMVILRGIK